MENRPIQPISNLFGHIVLESKRTHRSERGDLITYFLEKINSDRDGVKYKKLTVSYMAHKLSLYTTPQLYYLRIKCDEAKSFSKCFWFFANNKPVK